MANTYLNNPNQDVVKYTPKKPPTLVDQTRMIKKYMPVSNEPELNTTEFIDQVARMNILKMPIYSRGDTNYEENI